VSAPSANIWLITGGILSAIAAVMHLAIIIGGPDWYRFFGAGEAMVKAAEAGRLMPTIVTIGIAAMLGVWAAYAFSGAGLIARLPLLRTALVLISTIYLLRALAVIPMLLRPNEQGNAFWVWSSAIVLIYGLSYAIGTWRAWAELSLR
jgi:hypothetical protein